jgi:adenylylsulfate kinase
MPDNHKIILPHQQVVSREERSRIKNHQPLVLWFTGLSGSGKSSIANAVELILNQQYHAHTYLLDGDMIRIGLNKDLGFSDADRAENIRRIGEVSKLMYDAGLIVLTAFISPFQKDRDGVRANLPTSGFWEVFVKCPLEICEQRDPKGLYRKARAGELTSFTGIDSPYEVPTNPELVLHSDQMGIAACASKVMDALLKKRVIQLGTHLQ